MTDGAGRRSGTWSSAAWGPSAGRTAEAERALAALYHTYGVDATLRAQALLSQRAMSHQRRPLRDLWPGPPPLHPHSLRRPHLHQYRSKGGGARGGLDIFGDDVGGGGVFVVPDGPEIWPEPLPSPPSFDSADSAAPFRSPPPPL